MKLRKRLSQHFLKDKNILRKEVRVAGVRGRTILEIGAGDGRLTDEILDAGAEKVYVVEKDERFAAVLRERFSEDERVVVLEKDFLKMGIPDDVEVVMGNIPYYISSKIIFQLKDTKIERAVLMVQREFAEKMVAKPRNKNYGRLSVTSQIFFDVKIAFPVPAHLFVPKPRVDSALIVLKPKGVKLTEKEEDIIRKLFQHKNKMRRNTHDVEGKLAEKRPRELKPEEVLKLVRAHAH